MQTNVCIDFVM